MQKKKSRVPRYGLVEFDNRGEGKFYKAPPFIFFALPIALSPACRQPAAKPSIHFRPRPHYHRFRPNPFSGAYTVTRGSSLNRIKKITCFKLYWRKVYRRSLSFSFSFSYFLLPLLYPFSLFRQKTPVYFPQIQFETGYFFNPVQETSTRDCISHHVTDQS